MPTTTFMAAANRVVPSSVGDSEVTARRYATLGRVAHAACERQPEDDVERGICTVYASRRLDAIRAVIALLPAHIEVRQLPMISGKGGMQS